MKIVSWNVNSVRIRLNNIEQLVIKEKPQVLCLQETKVANNEFPFKYIKDLGFKHIEIYGGKGYNGVAIFSTLPLASSFSLNIVNEKEHRHVSVKLFNEIEIHNFYVPAGGEIPDPSINIKFKQKLEFMDGITNWFKENRKSSDKLVLLGDLNIAPLENDVWSHTELLKEISHTPIEIEKMLKLYKSLDWHDAIRRFTPEEEKLYSWWSYRNRDWAKSDRGRRLDHIWVSSALEKNIKSGYILRDTRGSENPSDHVPVVLELDNVN